MAAGSRIAGGVKRAAERDRALMRGRQNEARAKARNFQQPQPVGERGALARVPALSGLQKPRKFAKIPRLRVKSRTVP